MRGAEPCGWSNSSKPCLCRWRVMPGARDHGPHPAEFEGCLVPPMGRSLLFGSVASSHAHHPRRPPAWLPMSAGLESHSDPQTKPHTPTALSKSPANERGAPGQQDWERSPGRGRLQRGKDARKTKPLCFRVAPGHAERYLLSRRGAGPRKSRP